MSEERQDAERVRALLLDASWAPTVAPWVGVASLICLGVGALTFILGLLLLPGAAWGSLLANFLFWTGVAQAGVVTAAVFRIAPARWGRLVQRITSGLAAFLPFSFPLLLLLWFGRARIYWWVSAPVDHPWLNAPAMFVRDFVMLALSAGIGLWYLYLSLRPDVGAAREMERLPDRSFTRFLMRGWRGLDRERARSERLMRSLAPALVLIYVFAYSIISIDLSMTIIPDFRSTMFPVLYWISEFYAALAAGAVLAYAWGRDERGAGVSLLTSQSWGEGDAAPARIGGPRGLLHRRFLDVSNLVWGFAIFTAYIYWAQYIVVWMGNLPFEAQQHIGRWRVLPWSAVSWVGIFLAFLIPFFTLFSRWVKQNPKLVAVISGLGFTGVLFQRYLDVLPFVPPASVRPTHPPGATGYGLIELGVTLGFLGGMALCYVWLMRRVPLFPIEDPLFVQAVALEEVGV